MHDASQEGKGPTRPIDWSQYVDKPTPSTLQNIVGPVLDPMINMANFALRQGHRLGQLGEQAGLKTTAPAPSPKIPHIPYKPGIRSTLLEMGGYLIPGEAEFRAANVLGRGAMKAIPALGRLAERKLPALLGRLGKAGAVGVGTAVPARDPGQSVESAALGGGLGGVFGEGLARVVGKVAPSLLRGARFNNFKNAFLKGAPKKLESAAQTDALNHVVDSYQAARKAASKPYKQLWDHLKTSDGNFTFKDVPNLSKLIEKDGDKAVLNLEDIDKNEAGHIDPEQFHFLKSGTFQAAKKSNKLGDVRAQKEARQGFKYHKAMETDFDNFLSGNNQLENYQGAQENWKKTILPYIDSKIFSKILDEVKTPSGAEEINHEGAVLSNTQMSKLKGTARLSKLAKRLLPGAKDADEGAINEFANLLGNDKGSAIQHIRNLLFSKHYEDKEFNMGELGKELRKLKGDNRELILSPHERDQLEEMNRLGKMKLSPWKKAVLGTIVGGALTHHLGGEGMHIAEGGGLGIIGQHYLDPAIESFLGSSGMQALERRTRKAPSLARVGIPLGAMVSTIGEPNA